jgi:hypothetical protein
VDDVAQSYQALSLTKREFASGEELIEDGKTLYRMTNGSIQMCE